MFFDSNDSMVFNKVEPDGRTRRPGIIGTEFEHIDLVEIVERLYLIDFYLCCSRSCRIK